MGSQLDVTGMSPVNDLIVGNSDDHRRCRHFGEQVVHNEVHASVMNPVVWELSTSANQGALNGVRLSVFEPGCCVC